MGYQPLISVCMPVYNTERYVRDAIESVLAQTYENFELVVCDNCSTDGSAAIVAQLAKDPRIRFVRNRWNLGYAGNLQKVTQLARGDLVITLFADDLMLPSALQTYVDVIAQSGRDPDRVVIMADYYQTDASGRPFAILGKMARGFEFERRGVDAAPPADALCTLSGREILRARLPDLQLFGWIGSVMLSRTLLAQAEGYQGGKWISPDKDFLYRLFALDPPILYLQRALFCCRMHESNQLGTERRHALIKHALDQYEYTFQYDDPFLQEFGTSRRALQELFVDRDCLRKALHELAVGSPLLAFRYVAFALATYPGIALSNWKLHAAVAGLLGGPVGRLIARRALRAWRRRQELEAGGPV